MYYSYSISFHPSHFSHSKILRNSFPLSSCSIYHQPKLHTFLKVHRQRLPSGNCDSKRMFCGRSFSFIFVLLLISSKNVLGNEPNEWADEEHDDSETCEAHYGEDGLVSCKSVSRKSNHKIFYLQRLIIALNRDDV